MLSVTVLIGFTLSAKSLDLDPHTFVTSAHKRRVSAAFKRQTFQLCTTLSTLTSNRPLRSHFPKQNGDTSCNRTIAKWQGLRCLQDFKGPHALRIPVLSTRTDSIHYAQVSSYLARSPFLLICPLLRIFDVIVSFDKVLRAKSRSACSV